MSAMSFLSQQYFSNVMPEPFILCCGYVLTRLYKIKNLSYRYNRNSTCDIKKFLRELTGRGSENFWGIKKKEEDLK